jgi:benzoyl-CoA reductase/2-hydroxyglutaryl-CoA dehydratase subunit BcrC/BadD/HgdB
MARTIVSLPIYGIDELFAAYGFRIQPAFGRAVRPVRAFELVQSFACHVAASCLEELETRGLPEDWGVFVPSPCDTLNNLADIIRLRQPERFVAAIDFPEPEAAGSLVFLTKEIARVKRAFLAHFDLEEDREAEAAALRAYAGAHRAVTGLYQARREGRICLSARDFQDFMVAEPGLARDELEARAVALMTEADAPADGVPLFVSGIVLPPALAEALDDAGFRVVDDDLAQGFRRFSGPPADPHRPIEEALAARYLTLAPCSTFALGPHRRSRHVAERVAASGARAFLYLRYPWCEPEAFDAPPMLAAVEARGVQVREVTLNPTQPDDASTQTRIEAFRELLG